jgi:hypothetical protein
VVALLERHRETMGELVEVDGERALDSDPSRAQKLRLRRIGREEAAIGVRCGELAAAIEAEQSLVSAELLRNVQYDLERVAREVDDEGDYQTGERTQGLQRDVEEGMLTLLEVLRQEQMRRQQQDAQQQAGQNQDASQQQSLIPDTAELKLLRGLEVDVQTGVSELLRLYPELSDPELPVDELVLEDIARLAARHERITALFRHLRQKVGIPPPPEEGTETEEGR